VTRAAHFVHGAFNRNASGWDDLEAAAQGRGDDTVVHDYGWVGPLTTRRRSRRAGEELATEVESVDAVIAFSNGGLVCWEALRAGMQCRDLVLIQPALDKHAEFDEGAENIVVLWNRKDLAVQLARIYRIVNPASWAWRHGWGAMGRYGPKTDDPRVTSIDTEREADTTGHTQWRGEHAGYWTERILDLIE